MPFPSISNCFSTEDYGSGHVDRDHRNRSFAIGPSEASVELRSSDISKEGVLTKAQAERWCKADVSLTVYSLCDDLRCGRSVSVAVADIISRSVSVTVVHGDMLTSSEKPSLVKCIRVKERGRSG